MVFYWIVLYIKKDDAVSVALLQKPHHKEKNGDPSGARTLDPLIKSQMLYQLS